MSKPIILDLDNLPAIPAKPSSQLEALRSNVTAMVIEPATKDRNFVASVRQANE